MKLDLSAPHTKYLSSDGKELTGVTTYLSVIAKPQLLKWYATEERKGVLEAVEKHFKTAGPSTLVLPKGPFAEAKRDKAADLGTVTHALIEAWLKSDPLERDGIPDEVYDAAHHGLNRFLNFWLSGRYSIIESERVMVYESVNMAFGGTVDIIASKPTADGDKVVLIDIKTTKPSRYWPYPETFAQVAAYSHAYSKITGTPVDSAVLVRVGKEPGDELETVVVTPEQLMQGWCLFYAAYRMYESKKKLERS
jgi:hypothetical protein